MYSVGFPSKRINKYQRRLLQPHVRNNLENPGKEKCRVASSNSTIIFQEKSRQSKRLLETTHRRLIPTGAPSPSSPREAARGPRGPGTSPRHTPPAKPPAVRAPPATSSRAWPAPGPARRRRTLARLRQGRRKTRIAPSRTAKQSPATVRWL